MLLNMFPQFQHMWAPSLNKICFQSHWSPYLHLSSAEVPGKFLHGLKEGCLAFLWLLISEIVENCSPQVLQGILTVILAAAC